MEPQHTVEKVETAAVEKEEKVEEVSSPPIEKPAEANPEPRNTAPRKETVEADAEPSVAVQLKKTVVAPKPLEVVEQEKVTLRHHVFEQRPAIEEVIITVSFLEQHY